MQKFAHYAAYLGLRAFEGLLRLLPLRLCCQIGSFGGRSFAFFAPQYRRLVIDNLRIAYSGELGEDEIRDLAGRHFATLGSNMIASLKVATMPIEAVRKCVRYEGHENLLNASQDGRGVVGAIGHFGNWELLSQVSDLFARPGRATMFQSLANPYINAHVVRSRGRMGVTLFDRTDGVFGPLKYLREGGGLGILFDQHAGDLGTWCPLFGRLASTTKLPALLAIKAKTAIVPMAVHSDGPGRWKIVIEPAIEPASPVPEGIDRGSYLTLQLNRALERLIRRAPAEWFWVHDRWKTPDPDFLLATKRRDLQAARFAEQEKSTTPGQPTLKPFRLLVRSPNPLGDACMAIPAIRALKHQARPDLEITILCRKNLQAVWQRIDAVDHVIAIDRADSARTVGTTVRNTARFDVALLLPNSLSSALECRFAGIPRIVGLAGHQRRRFLHQVLTKKEVADPRRHHAETYLHLAAQCGASLEPGSTMRQLADQWATVPTNDKPTANPSAPIRIGICPGAEYGNAKRYPLERYAETILSVQSKLSGECQFRIFGSPNETDLAGELATLVAEAEVLNLAGKTDIAGLCDELSHCDVVVSNDTGTMHLAAALGVPTVAIFGSTEPAWTAPLGTGHRVIRRHVECSPCFLRECPRDYRCMHEIDNQKVIDAVLELATRGETS